jgi:hypothetical protein
MDEKSKWRSGETNSMSKATICCLSVRRCLMRNNCASVGEARDEICVDAVCRDRVVW